MVWLVEKSFNVIGTPFGTTNVIIQAFNPYIMIFDVTIYVSRTLKTSYGYWCSFFSILIGHPWGTLTGG